jgi:hypothetical protein
MGVHPRPKRLSRALSPCQLGCVQCRRIKLVQPVRTRSARTWPQIWVEVEETIPAALTFFDCVYIGLRLPVRSILMSLSQVSSNFTLAVCKPHTMKLSVPPSPGWLRIGC